MFIGPWNQGGPWDGRGIEGVARFLRRGYSLLARGVSAGAGGPQKVPRPTPGVPQKGTGGFGALRVHIALEGVIGPTN